MSRKFIFDGQKFWTSVFRLRVGSRILSSPIALFCACRRPGRARSWRVRLFGEAAGFVRS